MGDKMPENKCFSFREKRITCETTSNNFFDIFKRGIDDNQPTRKYDLALQRLSGAK